MSRVLMVLVATGCLFGASMAKADPVGGKVDLYDVVKARGWVSYKLSLYGGETTRIRVNGDGGTELSLLVYDENGNLVKTDILRASDDREVLVTPKWTGTFTIKIVNLGYVSNRYQLRID